MVDPKEQRERVEDLGMRLLRERGLKLRRVVVEVLDE